jgi:hypothetical protein
MDSFKPIDPKLIDVVLPEDEQGYPAEMAAGDTTDVLWDMCGSASRAFPQALWIEEKDWADKARENDANKTWPINFIDRFTNQVPSHECVYHSLTRGIEGARNRARGAIFADGPKKNFRYPESALFDVVWMSPMSGYARVQPRQWGGSNVRQSLEIACNVGLLPDTIQPKDYGFKHALQGTSGRGNNNQSGGSWIPVSRFPEGCEETSKHFRVAEAIFPESWQQAVCLVLHGMFVHVGRSGHAIPWGRAMFEGTTFKGMEYPDSYDILRYDSAGTVRSAWRGSFAIASTYIPDSWAKPAG